MWETTSFRTPQSATASATSSTRPGCLRLAAAEAAATVCRAVRAALTRESTNASARRATTAAACSENASVRIANNVQDTRDA